MQRYFTATKRPDSLEHVEDILYHKDMKALP
jgi:hypothetical protein